MTTPLVNERTYNETKRQLSLLARVMALDVVHRVQSRLLAMALEHELRDEVCRLIKSDIAESILAKDLRRVAQLPMYAGIESTHAREDALEAHLFGTLLGWILMKTTEAETARLVRCVVDLYEEPGTGTPA